MKKLSEQKNIANPHGCVWYEDKKCPQIACDATSLADCLEFREMYYEKEGKFK